jgi:class 3 adenylate cyclase
MLFLGLSMAADGAARLCAEAASGQVLVSQRVAAAAEGSPPVEPVGALTLKGFARSVPAFAVGGRQRLRDARGL